jgi:hypothetical protein
LSRKSTDLYDNLFYPISSSRTYFLYGDEL